MGRGGHNRVPRVVKEKRGTDRKDRRGGKAPPPEAAAAVVLSELTRDERAIVAQVEHECDGLKVNHRPFALWKELTARTLAEARKIDPEMAATARVKLYQAAHALLAAGGLTPASFDKVAAGEDGKGQGGPRTSLRGADVQAGASVQ